MNRVILTHTSKVGWTAALTALSFGICLLPLMRMSGVEIEYLTRDDLIRRSLILPLTVSFYVFVVCFALAGFDTAQAEAPDESVPAPEGARDELQMAQVIGVVWLNPLHRRDYPTKWRILRTLGLIKPDKGRDMNEANRLEAGALRPARTVARWNGESETFHEAHARYIEEMFGVLGQGRFEGLYEREDIGDLCVEYAIPAYRLDPVEVQNEVRRRMESELAAGDSTFEDRTFDLSALRVHITRGGSNAGFDSLNAALDYLKENPTRSVCVMSWDAPDCPSKSNQSNENMALLVLAGSRFEARRTPLAWIGRAARGNIRDYMPKPGAVRAIEAWSETIARAATNANSEVANLDYVVHDAGAGSEVASARLGTLGRSLTEMLAGFDYRKQTFNTAAHLGDMGAGSALTNIAMAIGRANHVGNTVLVAGTTDSDRPVAVVVVPPGRSDRIDVSSVPLQVRSGSSACIPWWGDAVASKNRLDSTRYGNLTQNTDPCARSAVRRE